MDANLKRLGAVVSLSVKDRDLATPPASPANGDRYIVPVSATGVWAGRTAQIAVRVAAAWAYRAPTIGWTCFIEDARVLSVYEATGWRPGIAV